MNAPVVAVQPQCAVGVEPREAPGDTPFLLGGPKRGADRVGADEPVCPGRVKPAFAPLRATRGEGVGEALCEIGCGDHDPQIGQ